MCSICAYFALLTSVLLYTHLPVKVSNLVRSEISKHGDKLFDGLQSRCRVYDNYFILRCYNCLEFGHHSTKCGKPGPACAYCAGQHRTDACRRKEDDRTKCYKNCKLAKIIMPVIQLLLYYRVDHR